MKNSLKALCLVSLVALVGCGQQRGAVNPGQADASIIGGKLVERGTALAITTVGLADINYKQIICTASIIGNRFILTAAHCVEGSRASDLRIVFGTHLGAPGTVIRKVSGFKFHKKWLSAGSSVDLKDLADIAVVKFDGGLPAGYKPARMISDNSLLQNGTNVLLAGYGHTDGIHKTGGGTLRRVVVKIEDANFSPSEVMLDQTQGKGACQGDSGGPAYVLDKDGRISLFGITSRGERDPLNTCGEKAVYTNALSFKTWIKAAVSALNAQPSALASSSNALGDVEQVASLN